MALVAEGHSSAARPPVHPLPETLCSGVLEWFEAQSTTENYGLVVVVLLVVVPPLAGSASVLLCVSELPTAPSLYVSCLVTAFPFHPVPCLVDVVLEPFGPEVTVVVDEPEPGAPCAKAMPVIKLREATPASRCLIILFVPLVVTTLA